jgi:tetratricopeptide (TPR) repeat protein
VLQIGRLSPTAQQQLEAYRVAAEKLAKATGLRPRDKGFLMRWAEALVLIGDLPVEARVKLGCYQGAAEKYRLVTELAPQEPEAFIQWGALLTSKLPQFAVDDKARVQLHQSAVELLVKAVERAKFSAEKGPAYVILGTALARQGRYATDLNEKKKLLRESVENFERAARAVPNTASTYALWGAAILELGKLTRLRTDYRDAASHLSTSLALNPGDPATLYTLACAYALMDSTALAITTLRDCFEKDLSGTYRGTAPREPDLAGLRGSADFEELFATKAKPATSLFNPPLRNAPR